MSHAAARTRVLVFATHMEINANKSRQHSPNPRFYCGLRTFTTNLGSSELANLGVARLVLHLTRSIDARQRTHAHARRTHARPCTRTSANARAHARQRGRTRASAHAHAHTHTHTQGPPAPAYERDRELAALQRALQVRCIRVLSNVCGSERHAGRGFD